jgi:hypothetical protein
LHCAASPNSEVVEQIVFALGAAGLLTDPKPQPVPVDADSAKAPWGRDEDGRPFLPMGAHWTDIPELVDREVASIRARVDQAQPGNWYVGPATETWRAPGTVRTQYDGYNRTVGVFTNVRAADLDLVLHAHSDLGWCLDMIDKLRERVAELEAERHTTNDALAEMTVAQRASSRPAILDLPPSRVTRRALAQMVTEDPHDSPLHHSYRVARDLPGGVL